MPHPSIEQLVDQLDHLLHQHPEGLGEHAIIKILSANEKSALANAKIDTSISLFQTHFILFHGLYLLRDQLWSTQSSHLEISALNIQLQPYQNGQAELARYDRLRQFYLNLDNLEQTSEQDVDTLLNSFWEYYINPQERKQALIELGLRDPVDHDTIKLTYRKLVMEHHPDRGGDKKKLQIINSAMKTLSQKS